MKTIERDMQALRDSMESLDAAKVDRIGSPSLGDVVRQGDVYLVSVPELPAGNRIADRQLAPGNTQGSRHVVEGECEIVPAKHESITVDKVLCGPTFECRGECTVTHPEHGDKILPAGTTWGVVYQRDHAEEVRRVQD